jgi:Gnt-I system high-affinity gluconate transporter
MTEQILPVAVAIAALVALVAVWRVPPFLAFLLVSIGAAAWIGFPAAGPEKSLPKTIQTGLGTVFGQLAITLVAGAMLGRLVVASGAAQRIADVLVRLAGPGRIGWAMAAAGFIIGIPLFYGVAFMLLVPILLAVVARGRQPVIAVALPACAAMSLAHGLLPPHPAPTALVERFGADMGRTLLLGIVVALPALVVGGPLFARCLRGMQAAPPASQSAALLRAEELPGTAVSFLTALLPVYLLAGTSVAAWRPPADPGVARWLALAGAPDLVMLAALIVAAVTLGIARGWGLGRVMDTYTAAIPDVAPTLLVIAGSGAFRQVLVDTGVDGTLATALRDLPLDPLVLAWAVTAVLRVCVGSATVAGLTAAGIVAPLVKQAGVDPDLAVLAVGAGTLFCSHVNDVAFWMFRDAFGVSLGDTLKSWTAMESIVSVVALVVVLVLDRLL